MLQQFHVLFFVEGHENCVQCSSWGLMVEEENHHQLPLAPLDLVSLSQEQQCLQSRFTISQCRLVPQGIPSGGFRFPEEFGYSVILAFL